MDTDIILKPSVIEMVGGPLVLTTPDRPTGSSRLAPLQASFKGSDNTRVELRSGAIMIQGQSATGQTRQMHVSPARIIGVDAISCGRLSTSRLEAPQLVIGGGEPNEPGNAGSVTVTNRHGQPSVRIDGEAGTVSAREPFRTLSDVRCKKDVETLTGALGAINRLRGVRFHWREPHSSPDSGVSGARLGLLAQEVQKVIPEAVGESAGFLSVSYAAIVPLLIEAMKEQERVIGQQRDALAAVERRIDELEAALPQQPEA